MVELDFDIPFRVATDGTIVKPRNGKRAQKGEYVQESIPYENVPDKIVPVAEFYGNKNDCRVWELVEDPMEVLREIVKALTK